MCSFKNPGKKFYQEKIANLLDLNENIRKLLEENRVLITTLSKKETKETIEDFYFRQDGKLKSLTDAETDLENMKIMLENLKKSFLKKAVVTAEEIEDIHQEETDRLDQ